MGLFRDFSSAGEQRDRLQDLKVEIITSDTWLHVANSPAFGSGISISFAIVDCRRCGKNDSGLLLDQSIWDWQTHKVSYSNCVSEQTIWVAENQGPQAAKSKSEWLSGPWTFFDEASQVATKMVGKSVVSRQPAYLEDWIVIDFMERGFVLKQRLASTIRESAREDLIQKLNQHISREGLEL